MSDQPDLRATFRSGDSDAVQQLARAARETARADGDAASEVEAVYALARVALRDGDLSRAAATAREALDIAQRSGDLRLEERPRHVLAAVARLSGDYAEAREQYRASIALNERIGDSAHVRSETYNLAITELHLGDTVTARRLLIAVRDDVLTEGDDAFVPYLGVAAAAIAVASGDFALAASLIGFTERAFRDLGQVPDPDDAQELDTARSTAIGRLSTVHYTMALEVGAGWGSTEALERI